MIFKDSLILKYNKWSEEDLAVFKLVQTNSKAKQYHSILERPFYIGASNKPKEISFGKEGIMPEIIVKYKMISGKDY